MILRSEGPCWLGKIGTSSRTNQKYIASCIHPEHVPRAHTVPVRSMINRFKKRELLGEVSVSAPSGSVFSFNLRKMFVCSRKLTKEDVNLTWAMWDLTI